MATTGAPNIEDGPPTTGAPEEEVSDVSVIIIVAACVGALFLVVLIIFIIFVIYFYRKQPKDDEFAKGKASMRADRLDWKNHSLAQQFGDINDIDEMLWKGRGRTMDDNTNNPAYGRDFEPLDVNNLKGFDSTDEDAGSTQQTESSSDLVEIKMEEEGGQDEVDGGQDNDQTKQISILDMKTWGQPGASRRNSMRSVHDFGAPPPFAPRTPETGRRSLRSQTGNPFPLAGADSSVSGQRLSAGHPGHTEHPNFPYSVSGPSNDPRFEYTRTNPLLGDVAVRQGAIHYPPGLRTKLTSHEQRDFGGVQEVDFERSNTLRSSRRNQSVVDFYESGNRTTSSNFNLSLEGSGSVGKNLLWQNKKFSGMGFANTK